MERILDESYENLCEMMKTTAPLFHILWLFLLGLLFIVTPACSRTPNTETTTSETSTQEQSLADGAVNEP